MRIEKLDGLRGLFCMMIVILHYKSPYLPKQIYNLFVIRESYVFVDFFFVLSGFVIAYNYNNLSSTNDFFKFIKKRILRLYPLLLYTSLVFLFFDLFSVKFFYHLVDHPVSFGETMLYFFDSIFFTNSTPILGVTPGINIPSWSISSEMISYLIFGLTLIFLQKTNIRSYFLVILILFAAISLIINGEFFTEHDYGFLRGLISFNIGYFVWKFSKLSIRVNNFFEYLILFGCLSLLYVLNSLDDEELLKSLFGVLVIPLFFGLSIFIFLKTDGFLTKIFKNRIFLFLGEISYSIYLNHFLLVAIIPVFFFKLVNFQQNSFTEILVFLITIIISIVYSYYTYVYVELKGGKILKKVIDHNNYLKFINIFNNKKMYNE